jgi:hypothetical protein
MLKDGIEKLPRFLRITVGQQLHRTLDVSKKNRDVFALTFERAFGSENLLGEVLGRIGSRRDEARLRNCTAAYRIGALGAELRSR